MTSGNGASPGLFKLDLAERKPFWLEVLPGIEGVREAVELLVKPFDSRVLYAATFESLAARKDIRDLVERTRNQDDAASREELAVLLNETAWTQGEQTFDGIVSMAKRVVLDWRGVGSWISDEPLPFSLYHLEEFFNQVADAASTFNLNYARQNAALVQEKKVSSSAPNGSVAEVPTTADDAGISTSPALAAGLDPLASAQE